MNQGKPSLEDLADENLLDIIRYLIYNHDTVAFGPPNKHENGTPRRSLGILEVSKRLSSLALSVLYGENVFVMSEDSILYHRHSSHPNNAPNDTRAVLSNRDTNADDVTAMNHLDNLSVTPPAQGCLQRLTIHASQEIMKAFYDYSLLITLSRMRALKTLRFLLKEDEAGNGLRYFETETPEKNADRFMFSVDCELAHVAEVVVEDPTVTNYGTVYGGALLRVVAALGDRNREWEMPRDVVEAFWGSFLGKEGGKWVR